MNNKMATLRIDNEDDELLERIRAQYILKGIKKTKKEILKEIIAQKVKEMHDLEIMEEETESIEEDYAWKMLDKAPDWGIKDTSTTVDQYLYGK